MDAYQERTRKLEVGNGMLDTYIKSNRGNTTQAFADYVTAIREIMY